jgi:hypothetical protein
VFAFSGFKREVQAMAKQHRGRVRVLQHGKKLSRHGLRKGDGLKYVFSSFFFCFFFFFESSKS